MIRDPDTSIPQPIPDEDIYAEVVETHGDKGALRAFNTVLQIYSNNLKERIEMKTKTKTPQTKKPRNPKHRRYGFKKAQRLRDEAEAALIEDMERHANMEMEQAAELDAAIRGEEE